MAFRSFLLLILACLLVGCGSAQKKKNPARKPPEETMKDPSNDPDFQSFLGLLRRAVQNHDAAMLASLMTPNFGYRLEPLGEGDGVFQFWDQSNVWPELQSVVNQKFVPSGRFMVSPAQFVTDPNSYHGYRAGITLVNGSWKFAYFVSG